MSTYLNNVLIDTFTDTLNVLVCTESNNIANTLNSYINRFQIFSINRAPSEKMADLYFENILKLHCIIIDTNISFTNSLFDHIEKLPHWISVILISDGLPSDIIDNWCINEIRENRYIYQNIQNNQRGCLVEICDRSTLNKISSILINSSLKSKFLRILPEKHVDNIIDSLYISNPESVEQWADSVNLTTRKLQRVLRNFTVLTPKKMLSLYHTYIIAFNHIGIQSDYQCEVFTSHNINKHTRIRFMEYILMRRNILQSCN